MDRVNQRLCFVVKPHGSLGCLILILILYNLLRLLAQPFRLLWCLYMRRMWGIEPARYPYLLGHYLHLFLAVLLYNIRLLSTILIKYECHQTQQ